MIEVRGNLWTYPADVRVITTNGTVKKNGECVMGRGCALEAKQRFTWLPKMVGDHIQSFGNLPANFKHSHDMVGYTLWTFPVKSNWYEKASLALIEMSARHLAAIFSHPEYKDTVVVMPRPGCGNGQLKWEDVKPILEPILDDRFHVITF
jgi:hypothetical protein